MSWGPAAGMLLFLSGGLCRTYMLIRVRGWQGYLSWQMGLADEYEKLVKEKKAPLWPLPASFLCAISGILLIFGSIIWLP